MISDCPYRGLVPFTENDRKYFFGRDPEREIIAANLKAYRLTVLYGASGTGKSSVLRAGVIHDIQSQAMVRTGRGRAVEFLGVYCQDWRERPMEAVSKAVQDAARKFGLKEPGLPLATLSALLAHYASELQGAVLLVLDQFEEYLQYHPGLTGPDEFDLQLAEALNNRSLRANFLLSLREDSLSRLDLYKGRIHSIFENFLRIDHLDEEAARQAIVAPVAAFCREHGFNEDMEDFVQVEPALVREVLEQVQIGKLSLRRASTETRDAAPQTGRVEAPFLQLVMTKLWEKEMSSSSKLLRRQTLKDLGEAETIVRNHLDDTMKKFSPEECETAERVFFHLVTQSGAKIAHCPTDLAYLSGLDAARIEDLLKKLSAQDCRVLRSVPTLGSPGCEERYEIYHDALAEGILDWRRRFRAELNLKAAEARALQERQEQQEELARERERDRARHMKILAIVSSIGVLVLAGLAFLAWTQRSAAYRAGREAVYNWNLAQERLDLYKKGIAIREAALTRRVDQLRQLQVGTKPDPSLRFGATAKDLGYANDAGDRVYLISLVPNQAVMGQNLEKIKFVTYVIDSPKFQNNLMIAARDRNFTASFNGVTCPGRVAVVVEFADPERVPAVTEFDMCDALGWKNGKPAKVTVPATQPTKTP